MLTCFGTAASLPSTRDENPRYEAEGEVQNCETYATEKNMALLGEYMNDAYTGRLARSMTIFINNGDGTTQMQFYHLEYRDGGYVVHRVYQNNNYRELFTRPFKLFKKLFDLIRGLFNK